MPKKGGAPQNLVPPWRKGESGNPKGRPKRDRIDRIMDNMRDEVGYRPREQLLLMTFDTGNNIKRVGFAGCNQIFRIRRDIAG